MMKETLEEHAPSYATVKNCVVHFKNGDFSTCAAPLPGQTKRVTSPGIIDQIHELSFDERRTSATSIDEQLGISCERVWSFSS
jgi:hypothetical protein